MSDVTMTRTPALKWCRSFISDIFKQKHWVLVKLELVFINTFKDHVNSIDASLRQYIFLQIGIYSMQKYPLQASQYEIECINVCFVQTERKFPYLPVNYRMFDDI